MPQETVLQLPNKVLTWIIVVFNYHYREIDQTKHSSNAFESNTRIECRNCQCQLIVIDSTKESYFVFCDNPCNINREFSLPIVFYLNDVSRVTHILTTAYFHFIILERRLIKKFNDEIQIRAHIKFCIFIHSTPMAPIFRSQYVFVFYLRIGWLRITHYHCRIKSA